MDRFKNRLYCFKIEDMCSSNLCKCQKQLTFSTKQYLLEGGSIKSKIKEIDKGTEKTWNKFLKPALNIASPYNGMAVAAKTINHEIGKATGSVLKSISGGEVLSLTEMFVKGLRLKVM